MEKPKEIQTRPPENKSQEKEQRMRRENQEMSYEMDVEKVGHYLSAVLRNGDTYKEEIPLNSDSEIDKRFFMQTAGRNILEMARSINLDKQGLNSLVDSLKDKFGHLEFTLKETKESLILSVESKIKINNFVQWVSQGSNQWKEPKRVIAISEDGLFAFVEGSGTGIPINQLEISH